MEPIPAFLDSTSPNRRYRPRAYSHLPYKRNSERRLQKVRDAQNSRTNKLNRTTSTESLLHETSLNDDNTHGDEYNDQFSISRNTDNVNKTQNSSVISISCTSSRRLYYLKSLGYEGLDYDTCENMLHLEEENNALRKGLGNKYLEFTRWLVIFCIGALTALTACCILFSVELLTDYKYRKLMVCSFF